MSDQKRGHTKQINNINKILLTQIRVFLYLGALLKKKNLNNVHHLVSEINICTYGLDW